MTRREAAEKVFDYIKENKFKPINIEYGNGYFIFDMGDDGVVHFNVKGLYGWKFAMWIETDPEKLKNDIGEKYSSIQFFCQHELNIDKFKPSRSFFVQKINLEDIESDDNWNFHCIKEILQMIKRHPFVSFTMDYCESEFYNKSYFLCYLHMKIYRIKKIIREWWKDTWIKVWHGSKVWFIRKYKVVDSVNLIDKNDDNWKVSPRYDMRIHFKVISADEKIQEKAEIKMLNTWFHKNYYDNMYLELTREGIKGRYSYQMND